jgi:hypothetical protein
MGPNAHQRTSMHHKPNHYLQTSAMPTLIRVCNRNSWALLTMSQSVAVEEPHSRAMLLDPEPGAWLDGSPPPQKEVPAVSNIRQLYASRLPLCPETTALIAKPTPAVLPLRPV